MQVGELWVKIGARDDALNNALSGTEKKLRNVGNRLSEIGSSLTKKITLPAVGATTAVGGLVAAFGWGRLKSMDEAEAKLRGLGYAAEDVARVTEQVRNAVRGTTMTMAEGTSVAAGALAAGVKEGAELERYIRLVGSAAVGANRQISDMALIFNRVQGSGRLMTQELNMIEEGMPGFAQAMANTLGVTQAEFRKMVTEGKVSSEQFLEVMEGFAGRMSEAYANSWSGLVSNTKAWIGIIGENLLSGVFEQSKESIREFMELLKSEKVQAWARETGEKIGEAFAKIVEKVKDVINWWTSLDAGTQALIGKFALFVVSLGPVLSITGKVIDVALSLKGAVTALIPVISSLGSALTFLATNPIGAVITAIGLLIAAGVLLYQNWDTVKEKAAELGEHIAAKWEALKAKVTKIWDNIKNTVVGAFQWMYDHNYFFEMLVDFIREKWEFARNITNTVWQAISDFLTNLWTRIKTQASNMWNQIYGVIRDITNRIRDMFNGLVKAAWDWGKNLLTEFIAGIKSKIRDLWDTLIDIADTVAGFLGFHSPTKLGPGRYADQWAPNFVKMFTEGLQAGIPRIESAMSSLADRLTALTPATLSPAVANSYSTSNTSYGPIVIHVHGANGDDVLRTLKRDLHRAGVRWPGGA